MLPSLSLSLSDLLHFLQFYLLVSPRPHSLFVIFCPLSHFRKTVPFRANVSCSHPLAPPAMNPAVPYWPPNSEPPTNPY